MNTEKTKVVRRAKKIPSSLVGGSFEFAPSNQEGMSLKLSLRLNECSLAVPSGTYRIAITEICFGFELRNCVAPSEDWLLDPSIDMEIESEDVVETSNTLSGENAIGSGGEFDASLGNSLNLPGLSTKISAEQKSVQSNSSVKSIRSISKSVRRSISAAGNEAEPKWYLRSSNKEDYLRGAVCKGNHFLRIRPTSKTGEVSLWVSIPSYGVLVGNTSGDFDKLGNRSILAKWLIKRAICDEQIILHHKDIAGAE